MLQTELNQIQVEVQGSGSESPSPEAASSSLMQDCEDCHKPFEITPSEKEWKKKCLTCFIKSKRTLPKQDFQREEQLPAAEEALKFFNEEPITGTEESEPERKQEVIMDPKKKEETPKEKMLSTGLTGVFVVHTHIGKVELKPEDINEIEVGGFGGRDGRLDTKDNEEKYTHHVYSVPNYELEELQVWMNEHKKVKPEVD